MQFHFTGLVAAPFTPLRANKKINLDAIPDYARFLKERGVSAAFVCGTTGEGASLSIEEREQILESWVNTGDLPIIAHVGHTALPEAMRLAAHAQASGAVAISTLAPFFFKPLSANEVSDWCSAIASQAPGLPFYYYHIPSMTGVNIHIKELLQAVEPRIPNFAGVKFTHEDLEDFSACLNHTADRFDMLFGRDELLLEGTQLGARGAVGSTYNYAVRLYQNMLSCLRNNDVFGARMLQDKAIAMIDACNSIGVTHLAASKAIMQHLGIDCGPVRLPLQQPSTAQVKSLHQKLEALDLFTYIV